MTSHDMPTDPTSAVACTLSPGDAHERRRWFQAVMSQAEELTSRPRGRTAYFAADPTLESELHALARAEADCCQFLHFEVAHQDGRLSFTVTGPADAMPVIEQMLAGRDDD